MVKTFGFHVSFIDILSYAFHVIYIDISFMDNSWNHNLALYNIMVFS